MTRSGELTFEYHLRSPRKPMSSLRRDTQRCEGTPNAAKGHPMRGAERCEGTPKALRRDTHCCGAAKVAAKGHPRLPIAANGSRTRGHPLEEVGREDTHSKGIENIHCERGIGNRATSHSRGHPHPLRGTGARFRCAVRLPAGRSHPGADARLGLHRRPRRGRGWRRSASQSPRAVRVVCVGDAVV